MYLIIGTQNAHYYMRDANGRGKEANKNQQSKDREEKIQKYSTVVYEYVFGYCSN